MFIFIRVPIIVSFEGNLILMQFGIFIGYQILCELYIFKNQSYEAAPAQVWSYIQPHTREGHSCSACQPALLLHTSIARSRTNKKLHLHKGNEMKKSHKLL